MMLQWQHLPPDDSWLSIFCFCEGLAGCGRRFQNGCKVAEEDLKDSLARCSPDALDKIRRSAHCLCHFCKWRMLQCTICQRWRSL